MRDSRRFETELHEGDLVFTVRRGSDLLFSKAAVRELQDEVEAFIECAVSRSEATAIGSDCSVVTSRHVKNKAPFEDSLPDRLRGLVNAVGGGLFCVLIDAMWGMRAQALPVATLQFAITCGLVGLSMMMIGVFGWGSIARSRGGWRSSGRRAVGAGMDARSLQRTWWSRDG
jgi:hypothetical protein